MDLTLFQKFTKFVLECPKVDINRVYNTFLNHISEEEQTFVTEHYALFIKCGVAAKSAIPAVQEELRT